MKNFLISISSVAIFIIGLQVPTTLFSQPLTLNYSTFLGGTNMDIGYAIDADSSGAAYVTGSTSSLDFPTVNPYQATRDSGTDCFVTCFSPSGSALVFSTYLGGDNEDIAFSVRAGTDGTCWVGGSTYSTDFPTVNPYQASNASALSNYDAFLCHISSSGTALLYSSFLGGSNAEQGYGIVLDESGNPYLAGRTGSTDFPTVNPYQAILNGTTDVFIARFTPGDSTLVYSTYLGGSGSDYLYHIGNSLDAMAESAYITGYTNSADFPTVNPYQASNSSAASDNAFLARLDPTGSALVFSTYLGGSQDDEAYAVDVISSGDVFIAGRLGSTDFPTLNPYQGPSSGPPTWDGSAGSTPPGRHSSTPPTWGGRTPTTSTTWLSPPPGKRPSAGERLRPTSQPSIPISPRWKLSEIRPVSPPASTPPGRPSSSPPTSGAMAKTLPTASLSMITTRPI